MLDHVTFEIPGQANEIMFKFSPDKESIYHCYEADNGEPLHLKYPVWCLFEIEQILVKMDPMDLFCQIHLLLYPRVRGYDKIEI